MQVGLVLIVEFVDDGGRSPMKQLLTPRQLLAGEIEAAQGNQQHPYTHQHERDVPHPPQNLNTDRETPNRNHRRSEFRKPLLAFDPSVVVLRPPDLDRKYDDQQQWWEPQP